MSINHEIANIMLYTQHTTILVVLLFLKIIHSLHLIKTICVASLQKGPHVAKIKKNSFLLI